MLSRFMPDVFWVNPARSKDFVRGLAAFGRVVVVGGGQRAKILDSYHRNNQVRLCDMGPALNAVRAGLTRNSPLGRIHWSVDGVRLLNGGISGGISSCQAGLRPCDALPNSVARPRRFAAFAA